MVCLINEAVFYTADESLQAYSAAFIVNKRCEAFFTRHQRAFAIHSRQSCILVSWQP